MPAVMPNIMRLPERNVPIESLGDLADAMQGCFDPAIRHLLNLKSGRFVASDQSIGDLAFHISEDEKMKQNNKEKMK